VYIYTMNNTHTQRTMQRFTITTTNTINDRVELLECTNENHRRAVASEIVEHYAAKPEFISVSQHIVNGENVAIIHMTNGKLNMIFRQR